MLTNCPIACDICDFCEDFNQYCEDWARLGECTTNRKYMNIYCKKVDIYNFNTKVNIFFQVLWSLWQWSNSTNSFSNNLNDNKATNDNKKNNNYYKAATEALLLQGQEL